MDDNTAPIPELADTVPATEFLDHVADVLVAEGLTPERTLAAVAICRDELTQPMVQEVADRWGTPFALSGLGGLPALGATGWRACLSHVPQRGRGHLLVIGFPHLGVTGDGAVGASLRRQQDRPTPSCGALAALLATFDEPDPTAAEAFPEGSIGLTDTEFDLLSAAVCAEIDHPPATLFDLTLATASAIRREIWAELDALEPWAAMDVTFVSGIQVHIGGQPDHVLPLGIQVRHADGVVDELPISAG